MQTSGIVIALGLDWPWMLGWLPAVALPFIIARLAVARARPVRWAPIDIVARAARRAGLSREGFSTPLLLLRAAMLLLAVAAAARPFLAPRADARPFADGAASVTGPRRIMFVAPGAAAAESSGGPVRLAIEAIRKTGASVPAVEVVATPELAASSASAGSLVILADGIAPTGAAAERLAQALHRGATVLVLVGPETAEGPARRWLSNWLDGLTGLRVAGRVTGAGQRIAVASSLADFPGAAPTADAFVALPGPSVSSFADLVIPRGDAAPLTMLARTVPEGRPLFVEARVGAGRLCVSGLPLSLGEADAWSDLAAWPVFVPLVDRLVSRFLAGAATADAGQPTAVVDALRRLLPPARLFLGAALALAVLDPVLSWLLARRRLRTAPDRSFARIGWPARAAIVAALGAMFAGAGERPRADDDRLRRAIALVVDVSPSMATADVAAPSTPGDRISRLAAVGTAIDRARETNRAFAAAPIAYFTAARELQPHSGRGRGPESLTAVAVEPDASRIGDAIEKLLIGGPAAHAAIAIASDGMITSGATWEHAARIASARGVPLFAIPVGGPGADAEPASGPVTIVGVDLPRLAWREEEVFVAVEAEGPPGTEPLPIMIADRAGRALARGLIPAQTGVARMPSRYSGSLSWKPAAAGMQTLVARPDVEQAADEAARGMAGTTLVVDEPVSVLVVDAAPRFEFRFLEHLLASDRRFRVESCLLDGQPRAGGEGKRSRLAAPLPQTAADWSRFDVVVLGDIHGDDLPNDAATGLVDAVQKDGVGVAWLPGRRWHAHGPDASPLDDLLPASPGAGSSTLGARGGRFQWLPAASQAGWQPVAMPIGAEATSAMVWPSADGVSLEPTARVLAITTFDDAAPAPAVILDQRGAGTILGTLFTTWRLRGPSKSTGAVDHDAFWRHALTRLAESRILARHKPAMLGIEPARPAAGGGVRVDIEPTRPAADLRGWELEHTRPGGRQDRTSAASGIVRLDHLEPGWHSVALVGLPASPAATGADRPIVSRDFLVLPPQVERPGPPAMPAAFEAAAVASGGDAIPLESLGSLPERLARIEAARASTRPWLEAARPSWLHGPLATSLLMLACVAACAIEWSARARRGLP